MIKLHLFFIFRNPTLIPQQSCVHPLGTVSNGSLRQLTVKPTDYEFFFFCPNAKLQLNGHIGKWPLLL